MSMLVSLMRLFMVMAHCQFNNQRSMNIKCDGSPRLIIIKSLHVSVLSILFAIFSMCDEELWVAAVAGMSKKPRNCFLSVRFTSLVNQRCLIEDSIFHRGYQSIIEGS